MATDEVRVPTEWVEDAYDAIEALYEAEIYLDDASASFRDDDRYGRPPGFSIDFRRPAFPPEDGEGGDGE